MIRSGAVSIRLRAPLVLVLLVPFVATPHRASAMQAGSATADSTPVVVTGTVYDSVAHAPLTGALVQLVDPQHASHAYDATTDSLGAFRMPAVVPGRYAAGFYHPSLEALGLQPPLAGVDVEPGRPASIALVVPGGSRVSTVVCGERAPTDSLGALVGMVRDADSGTPLAGARIIATWQEWVISAKGMRQTQRRIPALTREDGGYVICGLPNDRVIVSADSGTRRSGQLEIDIPMRGLVRRDFAIAPPIVAVAALADSIPGVPRATVLRGTARLAGVVRGPDHQPVSGARVAVPGTGLSATTGASGQFSIDGLPAGTFSAQGRAIGLSPVTVPVDLASARTTSVTITLATPAATTLAAVTVYGKRPHDLQEMEEFAARKRQGFGHYLVPADVQRHLSVTDALRSVPGIQVAQTATGVAIYGSRGCSSYNGCGAPGCVPAIFLDGNRLGDKGADPPDINDYILPEQVLGIEVYGSEAGVPPQYVDFGASGGCGVVLIWSKH